MLFQRFIELKQGDYLYSQGDPGDLFYFVLTGRFEVLVKTQTSEDFKYSKGVDESTFFGLKKYFQEPRSEYAKVASETLSVIEFSTRKYNDIISKT